MPGLLEGQLCIIGPLQFESWMSQVPQNLKESLSRRNLQSVGSGDFLFGLSPKFGEKESLFCEMIFFLSLKGL